MQNPTPEPTIARPLVARAIPVFLSLALSGLLFGCGTSSGPSETGVALTADGLQAVEVDLPGRIFLRESHQIGSYDAFTVPPATVAYARNSQRLPEEMEAGFLASLEQSLIDAADDAGIPIVDAPGQCVLQVGLGFTDVKIARGRSKKLGEVVLVMEFRDTLSGAPLLRYAVDHEIERDGTGAPLSEQIALAFDDMVAEMNVAHALRASGLGGDTTRAGCNGTLAAIGQGASPPAVSAGPPN